MTAFSDTSDNDLMSSQIVFKKGARVNINSKEFVALKDITVTDWKELADCDIDKDQIKLREFFDF